MHESRLTLLANEPVPAEISSRSATRERAPCDGGLRRCRGCPRPSPGRLVQGERPILDQGSRLLLGQPAVLRCDTVDGVGEIADVRRGAWTEVEFDLDRPARRVDTPQGERAAAAERR